MKKYNISLLAVVFTIALCVATVFGLTGCFKNNSSSESTHTHKFEEIADSAFLKSEATCTKKAVYYRSCACGEKSSETFEYGNALNHSFTKYVSDNNATCTEDGTKTAKCDRCDETDTIADTGSKLGHEFTNYISDNNATYEKDGTKTAHCNHQGCTVTDTITDEGSKLESKLSFRTLSVTGDKVYGKVSNDIESFSFIKEIKTAGLMKFVVSLDIYGSQQVATKTIPLHEGDNVVYIIEMLDGEPQAVYEVTIRRKPLYTVNFNTNGGTKVSDQQVEEGFCATMPSGAPERNGYTFDKWYYDFSIPITKDTTIDAKWDIITYSISYNLNGGTNDKSNPITYTVETPTIDFSTPSRTGYTFKGWHIKKDFSDDNITGLPQGSYGSITLYADWQIVTYNINYVLNGGETIGENPTGYTVESQDIILANPTGVHTFKGWYKDKTLKEKITIITSCSLGDITLYADWQHEISADWVIDKAPTCTNTGVRHKVCPICNVNYNYETLATVATAHTRGEKTKENLIESTCTEEGAYDIVIRCTECNVILSSAHVKTEIIAHEWDKTKHCKYCNCDYFSQDLQFTLSPSGTSYIISEIGSCVDSDIVIPANYKGNPVTSINYNAFYHCSGLTSIKIGNNVTSIGSSAFGGCSGLTSITIPDSVTSIGSYTFSGCSGLTSIAIPDSVTSIGDSAFSGCSGLTSITIPDSITSIGNSAFGYCSGLTSITIPDSITSIGDSAFSGCSGLTSITIPDRVTSIGEDAFGWCCDLVNINVSSKNSKYHSQGNCIIETATKVLVVGCKNSIIPNDGSVTSIGNSAFSGCSGLTSIAIPDSVTSIGNSAFSGCGGLTSITIPDGVTSISKWAFYNCSGLTSITIGNCVTSIGNSAFSGCSGLTSITIPDGVASISKWAFYNCSGLKIVFYEGTKEQWNKISIDLFNNDDLTSATRYYYSETEPALNSDGSTYDGNYWHYDTNGTTPVIWKKQ